MISDLPKSVPSVILSAAEAALEETEDRIQRRRDAEKAYRSEGYRLYAEELRQCIVYDNLPVKAQALVDWGAMLQKELPLSRLSHRFWTSGAPHAPCLPVAVVEIDLSARGDFQGGMFKTELLLVLDPKEGLFRHEDRFNGFLVNGVGLVNSPTAVLHAIHPQVLARLHEYVATKSHVWWYVQRSFHRLVDAFKDR